MFDLRASVTDTTIPVPNIKSQRIISEVWTGYCRLNGYLHKIPDGTSLRNVGSLQIVAKY